MAKIITFDDDCKELDCKKRKIKIEEPVVSVNTTTIEDLEKRLEIYIEQIDHLTKRKLDLEVQIKEIKKALGV